MAKKRSPANRRKRSTVVNFNQNAHRKRSHKRSKPRNKVAYSQDAAESSRATSSPQPPPEDLAGLATQFASSLEKYARTFGVPVAQEVADIPRLHSEQSRSLTRNAMHAINRELLDHFVEQTQRFFQAMSAFVRCRSPQDLIMVQTELAKANLNSALKALSSILNVIVQMTTESLRLIQLSRTRLGAG
jgi:hypothetical protein